MSDTRQCHVCEMQYQADHDVAPQDGTTLAICVRCLPYWDNGYQDGAESRQGIRAARGLPPVVERVVLHETNDPMRLPHRIGRYKMSEVR